MMAKNSGMTLIELLLVIAIIAVLGVSTMSIGQKFLVDNYLQNKTNELVATLRTAQLNAMSGKENSQWGVTVTNGQIILFKGSSYAGRDTDFDTSFKIPASIGITNDEIVFALVTGEPNKTANYNLSTNSGSGQTVSINQLGIIDVN